MLLIGGVGWMAGPACLVPRQSVALYEAARQGDWEEAMRWQRKLWAVNQAFSNYALAACIKGGLELQGFDVGDPIAPQQPLTEDGFREMRSVMEQAGHRWPMLFSSKRPTKSSQDSRWRGLNVHDLPLRLSRARAFGEATHAGKRLISLLAESSVTCRPVAAKQP